MHQFLKFILGIKLYMFQTVPLSIIRSFSLYTQQWYMSANLYVLLCIQWKTPDDGQRNCPKYVEYYSKNKFEKLVHLVGFIIRIFHDARSAEPQTFSNVQLATCFGYSNHHQADISVHGHGMFSAAVWHHKLFIFAV